MPKEDLNPQRDRSPHMGVELNLTRKRVDVYGVCLLPISVADSQHWTEPKCWHGSPATGGIQTFWTKLTWRRNLPAPARRQASASMRQTFRRMELTLSRKGSSLLPLLCQPADRVRRACRLPSQGVDCCLAEILERSRPYKKSTDRTRLRKWC